jgi:hypothetical protein
MRCFMLTTSSDKDVLGFRPKMTSAEAIIADQHTLCELRHCQNKGLVRERNLSSAYVLAHTRSLMQEAQEIGMIVVQEIIQYT